MWLGGFHRKVTGYSFEELNKLGKDFWVKNIHHADINHMNEKLQNRRITEGDLRKKQA